MKKVIFCGYGRLGYNALKSLAKENYRVVYIFTHKDLGDFSVDKFARDNNISYTYKDARKNKDIIQNLENINVDFLVSVNYRFILPKEVFTVADYALNIHGSLLPKYRGRTPHVWSIINGEEYSGITCHIIEESVDTGDIIEQVKIKIDPSDTGYSLLQKFEKNYPSLLIKSLHKIQSGDKLIQQNEHKASYYGKRIPEMGYIDFYKNSIDIINYVRAQAYPYPGAYFYSKLGEKIIVDKIAIANDPVQLDDIGVLNIIDNKYYVKCNDATLKIIEYR